MSRIEGVDQCPICRQNYVNAKRNELELESWYECANCGRFYINDMVLLDLSRHTALFPYLKAFIRQANLLESVVPHLAGDWPEMVEAHRHSGIDRKEEKVLRSMEQLTAGKLGQTVSFITGQDCFLADVVDQDEFLFLLRNLEGRGLIAPHRRGGDYITREGWRFLRPIDGGVKNRVFVAMSFSGNIEDAYQRGIKLAIEEDCKKLAVRVNDEHFAGKICDRIVGDIRSCEAVVADVTEHKQNVYFEAGFAMGLGRLVIYTCHKDDIASAHFDTRQYPHIVWDSPAELRSKLTDRIRALIVDRESRS